MEDILSKLFTTALDIPQMLTALQQAVPDIVWEAHESYHEGDYVLGRTENQTKLRIVEWGKVYEAEVYFPRGKIRDAQKKQLMNRLTGEILPAIKAENIEDLD